MATLSQRLAQSAESLQAEQGTNAELGGRADQLQKQVDELQVSRIPLPLMQCLRIHS